MYKFLVEQFLRPLSHRLASATGVFLASTGLLTEGDAATVESALMIAGGFLVDLAVRKLL